MEEQLIYIEEERDELEQTNILESLWEAVVELISPKAKIFLASFALCFTLDITPVQSGIVTDEPVATEVLDAECVSLSNVQQKLCERLDELISNPVMNEDGELKVNEKVVEFAKSVVKNISFTYLEGWRLYPDAKGAICWDYKEGNCLSSISMGTDGFSWFMEKGGKLEMKDNVELKEQEVLKCLKMVRNT